MVYRGFVPAVWRHLRFRVSLRSLDPERSGIAHKQPILTPRRTRGTPFRERENPPDALSKSVRGYGLSAGYGNFAALQPDEKIVVAGSSYDGQSFKMLLLRLDVNGAPDTGFGTDGAAIYQGRPPVHDYAFGDAIQQDGKILVAGTSNNGRNDDAVVLRYDGLGVLESGFGEEGLFTFNGVADSEDRAHGIAVQSDGRIVVAGYSHSGEDDDCLTFRLR
ncbi:MAG: delta-60 repeat domain-containing protein [Candidatus Desulfacyla sp.]